MTVTPHCYVMCKTAILKAKLADHYSITCVTNFKRQIENKKTILKRDYCNKNKSKLKKTIERTMLEIYLYMFEEAFPEYMHHSTHKTRLSWVVKWLESIYKKEA